MKRIVILTGVVSSLLSAVVAFVAVLVVTAPQVEAQPAVLSATGFRLVDAAGQARAWLNFDTQNRPQLELADPAGRARIRLLILDDGRPTVSLRDEAGNRRLVLTLEDDGTPSMELLDAAQEERVHLFLKATGEPVLEFPAP